MKKCAYTVTKNCITVNFEDGPRMVYRESELYNKIKFLLKEESWEQIYELLDPAVALENATQGKFRVIDGMVHIQGPEGEFVVHSDLNDTIVKFVKNQVPTKPLINFAVKMNQNPSASSVEQLFSFLKNNECTINENGNFILYKRIRSDNLDFYSRSIDNSPGKSPEMPRDQVASDPNATCSNGLHVAAYDYAANSYHSGEGKLILCEVDPKDVVSVPKDHKNQKLRVCKYKVLCETVEELKSSYLNSV